jgi:hypothetical protein
LQCRVGGINVFVSDSTNLVIDINGYFGQLSLSHAPTWRCQEFCFAATEK